MELLIEPIEESLMSIPVLFLAYLIVEYISNQNALNKIMEFGKVGPFIGAILGSIPQCGFSVVASRLYSMRYLTMGTLLSIFMATSDEALAILVAHPNLWTMMIILIVLKIVLGTVTGIIIDGFNHKGKDDYEYLQVEPCECGCQESIWLPAIRHTITTFIFILLTNIVFTVLVEMVGEATLTNLLQTHWIFQPLVAGLIGFIPNCAGSVILTQLYVAGGLSFGALVTGLTTSAGVGTLALIRYNENKKDTFKILLISYLVALTIGYILITIFK
ncbi:MAG: putative manganese transporter [Thomasclavelia sp.]